MMETHAFTFLLIAVGVINLDCEVSCSCHGVSTLALEVEKETIETSVVGSTVC